MLVITKFKKEKERERETCLSKVVQGFQNGIKENSGEELTMPF